MSIINKKRLSKKYKEIYEIWPIYNKFNIIIRLEKFLIRHIVRLLGFQNSIKLLDLFEKKIQLNNKLAKYIKYIIKINLYQIRSNIALGKKNLSQYLKLKKEWANYSIKQSEDIESIKTSKLYLSLLKKYCYEAKSNFTQQKMRNLSFKKKIKKIYIYGPNSKKNFNSRRRINHIFCFSKPLTNKNLIPINSVLFLNSYTFQRMNQENKKELALYYKKIFVHCKIGKITPPYMNALFPLGSNIGSPMGLMRILYCLNHKYKNVEYEIDGFDLYTSKQAYSGKIITGVPYTQDKEREIILFESLTFHDPLFNFLCLKNEVEKICLKKSKKLNTILNKTPYQYMSLLFKARKYEPEFTL